jgi:hypothetical protein
MPISLVESIEELEPEYAVYLLEDQKPVAPHTGAPDLPTEPLDFDAVD